MKNMVYEVFFFLDLFLVIFLEYPICFGQAFFAFFRDFPLPLLRFLPLFFFVVLFLLFMGEKTSGLTGETEDSVGGESDISRSQR